MIKKSIGFNWGPSAVGTTMWTGVCRPRLLSLSSRCIRLHDDAHGFTGPDSSCRCPHE